MIRTSRSRRGATPAAIALRAACVCLPYSSPLFAESEFPTYRWTGEDTAQMLRALVAMNRDEDPSKSVELAVPLYRRAPYHCEEFRDRDYEAPGVFPSSPLSTTKWTVAEVLARALERDRQYPAYFAVCAGNHFRLAGMVPPHDTSIEAEWVKIMHQPGKEYGVAVALNDIWVDFSPAPVLQEERLLIPISQLGLHLGLEVKVTENQRTVELTRKEEKGLVRLLFAEGARDVGKEGAVLERAATRHGGQLMVTVDDAARVLGGEMHRYPKAHFVHLIIPSRPKAVGNTQAPGPDVDE